MPVYRRAAGRRLHPRYVTVVRRISTDRIRIASRGPHRSNSRLQACGNRCSRAMWARFRRVADRTANSQRAAAAICSVRARVRLLLATVEWQIAARAIRLLSVRIAAGSIHPTQPTEIVLQMPHPAEIAASLRPRTEPCVPMTMAMRAHIWKRSVARLHRLEPRTAADSVLSLRPRARRHRVARSRVANPIRTRRAETAVAAATTGTVRRRVPRSSAVTAGMAVTRMEWAVDPLRILLLRVRS